MPYCFRHGESKPEARIDREMQGFEPLIFFINNGNDTIQTSLNEASGNEKKITILGRKAAERF